MLQSTRLICDQQRQLVYKDSVGRHHLHRWDNGGDSAGFGRGVD